VQFQIERLIMRHDADLFAAREDARPPWILPRRASANRRVSQKATERDRPLNVRDAERELMERALQSTGGNVVEAARLLGVHRSSIYRRFENRETKSHAKTQRRKD
jgi:transcriptional regulator of acetoin/glycerol metabolism